MEKDIVIIGGRSAGSVAALRSAQNDLDVALIEKDKKNTKTGRAYFRAVEAAYTKNKTEGFARITIAEETETILSGEIVGPDASELIHELEIAVQQGLSVRDVVQAVHAHPTLSEIIAKAAERGGDFTTYSI